MPFTKDALKAKREPFCIEAVLSWCMNFAAGVQDVSPPLTDNTEGDEHVLIHPTFLPATCGLPAAFAILAKAGFKLDEFLRHTLVHHTCDFMLKRPLRAGETFHNFPIPTCLEPSRSGTRYYSKSTYVGHDGSVCAVGYFGGVLLGYKLPKSVAEALISQSQRNVGFRPEIVEMVNPKSLGLKFGPEAAHVYDACIRDTHHAKPPSADANPHTNLRIAKSGRLPQRTLNGLCILGVSISRLVQEIDFATLERVSRLGCVFKQPVYIGYENVNLVLTYSVDTKVATMVRFTVQNEKGKTVIGDGYVDFGHSSLAKL